VRHLTKDTSEPITVSIKEAVKKGRAKLYAYKHKNTVAILSRLGTNLIDNTYGFVVITDLQSQPNYRAKTMEESIEKALNSGNQVIQFKGFSDLRKSWYGEEIK